MIQDQKKSSIDLRYSFLLLFFFVCDISNAQLTINVTSIPPSTPSGDDIYIAGNFNNWDPGNSSYTLTDQGNNTYSITFTPQVGLLEYKFTRGSWENVEGNASGNYIPNRTYQYSGGAQSINVNIAGWEDNSGNHTATENVTIVEQDFYMPQLDRTRRIWIYLPPDYDSTSKNYPVIYMQDGQNLFDAFYSFAGEWKIDESMNQLFDEGDYGAIVVGIDNGGNERINEYSAWINPGYGGGDGELYAEFLVNTLKPYIDSNYRTLIGREYTGIAGSSVGANISMYAAIEYQEVFSKVGIFSPAFWFSDSIYLQVTQEGIDQDMRFYFVAGDNESSTMVPNMVQMYNTLIAAGVNASDMNLIHHADGAHSEWYWAREYPDAYEWLFSSLLLGAHPLRIVKDFIYPNPTDKFIRVKGEEFDIPYKIYSSIGTVLRSAKTMHDRIEVESLSPGFYFLEIKTSGNEYYISRFIKN
ncbi:MAG TPA: alpha/beta hydrolase-fold protein [Saprospiraceae bacterium]|nr:alpha/beta hydrolase-fold protein [Saprospiraceae bacterium]